MLQLLKRIIRAIYEKSPKENCRNFLEYIMMLTKSLEEPKEPQGINYIESLVREIRDIPIFKRLIAFKIGSSPSIVLLGDKQETDYIKTVFEQPGQTKRFVEWNWSGPDSLDEIQHGEQILICKVPLNDHQWRAVNQLRNKYPQVVALHELLLPFTLLQRLEEVSPYFVKSFEERCQYYLGEKYYDPIDKLAQLFPLSGKNIIEFGPMDGYQTAGLVHAGAKKVTCVEARADNIIKTMVACYVFGWSNVGLVMDDFHNVSNLNYGCYDLAFAHGVYYHSVAPFLFLENLLSLSSNVFIGGFCATDSLPAGEFEILTHQGREYRAKIYKEASDLTEGMNRIGYIFHGDDLTRFFRERSYEVDIVGDRECNFVAGRVMQFLARKT
jgi:hypothetical protein